MKSHKFNPKAVNHCGKPNWVFVRPLHVCGFGDEGHTEWEAVGITEDENQVRAWVFDWIGHAVHAACKYAEKNGITEVYVADGSTLTHQVDVQKWLHEDVPNWPGLTPTEIVPAWVTPTEIIPT